MQEIEVPKTTRVNLEFINNDIRPIRDRIIKYSAFTRLGDRRLSSDLMGSRWIGYYVYSYYVFLREEEDCYVLGKLACIYFYGEKRTHELIGQEGVILKVASKYQYMLDSSKDLKKSSRTICKLIV